MGNKPDVPLGKAGRAPPSLDARRFGRDTTRARTEADLGERHPMTEPIPETEAEADGVLQAQTEIRHLK